MKHSVVWSDSSPFSLLTDTCDAC